MSWATNYALENIAERGDISADLISENVIVLKADNKPDVMAYISDAHSIEYDSAGAMAASHPEIDFVCGYRKNCIWHGDAITYLKSQSIGWGSFGTLTSALLDGDANLAEHKVFRFAARAIRQMGGITFEREYDRVIKVTNNYGKNKRIAFAEDYDPTADVVRKIWEKFGPVDVICNINPNGRPTSGAHSAAEELGTKILKLGETMSVISKR